jgi:shikimate kinase
VPETDSADVEFRHLVLIGLMGAGKTTVGTRVAARLGLAFADGDRLLERSTGRTAAALRDAHGVEALHLAESQTLCDALASDVPSVIAAAAAVVDDPACRAALRSPGVAVAWLRADPAILGRRFEAGAGGAGAHRPAYGAEAEGFLSAQSRRRAARFAACRPFVVVDTERLDPEAAVERIVTALGTRNNEAAR